ncbi:hypothetical protein EVAR_22147_1 [Eumeta japonica]|uniref:Uncharacterized protein n=1 Tax=Eumeta variegata TaxID=151549 RepID=A0A4C1VZM8_EUMVA|nr:hypothetical protein EVAR_22147_1 [Eumeta japonica]
MGGLPGWLIRAGGCGALSGRRPRPVWEFHKFAKMVVLHPPVKVSKQRVCERVKPSSLTLDQYESEANNGRCHQCGDEGWNQ